MKCIYNDTISYVVYHPETHDSTVLEIEVLDVEETSETVLANKDNLQLFYLIPESYNIVIDDQQLGELGLLFLTLSGDRENLKQKFKEAVNGIPENEINFPVLFDGGYVSDMCDNLHFRYCPETGYLTLTIPQRYGKIALNQIDMRKLAWMFLSYSQEYDRNAAIELLNAFDFPCEFLEEFV